MKEAVEMRRFDDMAKIVNKKTPSLNHFKPYLEEAFDFNLNNSFLMKFDDFNFVDFQNFQEK